MQKIKSFCGDGCVSMVVQIYTYQQIINRYDFELNPLCCEAGATDKNGAL
jgi:hypothetical protein